MRKCGIAYQPRGSGRRSFHSTQMIGGMPETRGRGTGGTERQKGKGREMRKTEPNWFSRIQGSHWRAVCGESCKHGFGKGRQEKVRKEPRLPPTSQHLEFRLQTPFGRDAPQVGNGVEAPAIYSGVRSLRRHVEANNVLRLCITSTAGAHKRLRHGESTGTYAVLTA